MPYGWLPKVDSLPWMVEGVEVNPATKTRREEYHLLAQVAGNLQPGLALDAGTGFMPGWHVAPYILANLGWKVAAVDNNPKHLTDMPAHPNVARVHEDICYMKCTPETFDLVCCISVLEHMYIADLIRAVETMNAVLKPGGTLFVTTDRIAPDILARFLQSSIDVGQEEEPPCVDLQPPVSFCYGTKL